MMSGATCGGGGYQKVNGAAANIMEDERRCDAEKVADDVMLPGFRFHPTDEELVGFYLKKKIQQKPLAIELIKQLDIYKYDPWDLPKLATTGEKEWYFYCPRDRKYRNSARPNRVTSAGFWKATGTDRPIYSSEGPKCIGLKKSLVFYKGRAAKGIKTDWMMHEFRLPSTADSNKNSIKPPLDKKIPPNDSWAICRIFKKTSSMAQRALAHSWAARLPEPTNSGVYYGGEIVSQLPTGSEGRTVATSHLNVISSTELPPTASFCFSPTASCNSDMASILMGIPPSLVCGDQAAGKTHSSIDFGQQESCDDTLHAVVHGEEMTCMKKNMIGDPEADLGAWQEGGFPFNFVAPTLLEAWKSNVQWESMPCSSSDVSGSCNFSKCHT